MIIMIYSWCSKGIRAKYPLCFSVAEYQPDPNSKASFQFVLFFRCVPRVSTSQQPETNNPFQDVEVTEVSFASPNKSLSIHTSTRPMFEPVSACLRDQLSTNCARICWLLFVTFIFYKIYVHLEDTGDALL